MNGETLFEALTDIDDALIAQTIAPPKHRAPIWLRVTATAACAALVIGGAMLIIPKPTATTPSVSNTPQTVETTATAVALPEFMSIPQTAENQMYPIVYPSKEDRVEGAQSSSVLACYSHGPYAGECWVDLGLSGSLEANEDPNAVYWVNILLHDKNGRQIMYGEEKRAEAQRLADLGYEIYIREDHWIGYWGEDKYYTTLCGYFTEDHLKHFCGNANYGYLLDFATDDVTEFEQVYAQE